MRRSQSKRHAGRKASVSRASYETPRRDDALTTSTRANPAGESKERMGFAL
jgi:hypothetical protein